MTSTSNDFILRINFDIRTFYMIHNHVRVICIFFNQVLKVNPLGGRGDVESFRQNYIFLKSLDAKGLLSYIQTNKVQLFSQY